MAIGPVQLIVLGFRHPDFHGEIIAELERLRESDTVRVIDALAVYKDDDGDIEVAHLSNLSTRTRRSSSARCRRVDRSGLRGRGRAPRPARAGRRGRRRRVCGLG